MYIYQHQDGSIKHGKKLPKTAMHIITVKTPEEAKYLIAKTYEPNTYAGFSRTQSERDGLQLRMRKILKNTGNASKPISPRQFTIAMKKLQRTVYTCDYGATENPDVERIENEMVDLMCELLRSLGYQGGVKAFEARPCHGE